MISISCKEDSKSISADDDATPTLTDDDTLVDYMAGEESDDVILHDEEQYREVSLTSSIKNVQPMTGIVLWDDSWNDESIKKEFGNIQLEYSYMRFNDVINEEGVYDFSVVESILEKISSRGHQAVLRFYYVYPGQETSVPDYIKALPDYNETVGKSEGKTTSFPVAMHL